MPPHGPNIVQIVADDMGYGDFGCFNFGASYTPTLDQLVDEGLSLTQHYAGAPVCAPARASLLTGRYPHRTGAVDTLEGRGLDRLALRERTIADTLSLAGYATGLVGKWHSGAFDPRYHPTQRGFDEFVGFRGGWTDYWDWQLERGGRPVKADGRYLTDVLTDAAVDFLRRRRAEPFYLQVAYTAPHYPMQAPEERVAKYRDRGSFPEGVAILYAMVEVMDEGIAKILQTLDDLGLADNTMLLFTSDNGPHFGEHDGLTITRYNCGFRGAKISAHEGGIRVPAVLRWPDGLDHNKTIHEVVHFTDWFPTILTATGATPDPASRPLDGIDALPILRGEREKFDDVRFWQFNRYQPVDGCNAAMRDGDWKLVYPMIDELMYHHTEDLVVDEELRYQQGKHTSIDASPLPQPTLPDEMPAPMLFNLAADPHERHDLATQHPQRVARMSADLTRWFEDVDRERRSIRD